MFDHLRELRMQHGEAVPSSVLRTRLEVEGDSIAIMSGQRGIHKPAQLDAALTLRTSVSGPYDDHFDHAGGGLVRYRYRDPQKRTTSALKQAEADNAAVRVAMRADLPIAYLLGIDAGWYVPFAPVQVVADDPAGRTFMLDLTELGGIDLREVGGGVASEAPARRYQSRVVQYRVHQARFRQIVLRAYQRACSMCALKREGLLDAAHLIPDAEAGEPVASNGVALCKIHHAAFDQFVLGVEPGTHRIHVREDVLHEIDGPMLRYGLQGLHGQQLHLPRRPTDRPATDALERRWERFRSA